MTDPKQSVLSPEVEEALQTLLSAVGWDSDSVRKAESTLRAALAQQQTKPEGGVVSAGPSGLAEGVRTEPLAPSSGPNPAAGDTPERKYREAVDGLNKATDAEINRAIGKQFAENANSSAGDRQALIERLRGYQDPHSWNDLTTDALLAADQIERDGAIIAELGAMLISNPGETLIEATQWLIDAHETAEAALAASNQHIKVLEEGLREISVGGRIQRVRSIARALLSPAPAPSSTEKGQAG